MHTQNPIEIARIARANIKKSAQADARELARTVGADIRKRRMLAEISMRDAASRIGCSAPHLVALELGLRFPSPKLSQRLFELLYD